MSTKILVTSDVSGVLYNWRPKSYIIFGGPNIMLLFYGLKFHICYFWGNPKNPQMCVPVQKFSRVPLPSLGSNLVGLILVPVDFYPGFYRKSFVLTWAWVTRIRFQIIAFSNGFTLDCIFKYMCFHDRLHPLRVDRK